VTALFQTYVYGAVPPYTLTLADPSQLDGEEAFVTLEKEMDKPAQGLLFVVTVAVFE
jgi:hypothetical protein